MIQIAERRIAADLGDVKVELVYILQNVKNQQIHVLILIVVIQKMVVYIKKEYVIIHHLNVITLHQEDVNQLMDKIMNVFMINLYVNNQLILAKLVIVILNVDV